MTAAPPVPAGPDAGRYGAIADATLAWSAARGYRGHNKHDALNSPLLRALLGWGKWPRLVAIQAVMRAPINLRPLLGVPTSFNPKGLALFVQARLDRFSVTGNPAHRDEAVELLGLLARLASPGDWSGTCWGYHYPWQDAGFFAPTATPNAVVTAFVCEAFLDAYLALGERTYLETVGRALPFFLNDLKILKDEGGDLCLSYMPVAMRMRVLDVSILIASVLARYGRLSGDTRHADAARRLAGYVVRRQTDQGAWFYTDPPGDSHIRHDNYHTGFILDALRRYMDATGEDDFEDAYRRGLEFYARHHFSAEGAPRWMSDCEYPYDIHGAAQGILTFARHAREYPGLAARVADWALRHMYHPDGRFYYQRTRWYTKRFTLMRWCNGWMSRALARFAAAAGQAP
ncbi:MAG: hypothetical protein AB7Q97_09825 [Gammaproteobacteria bacterium]